MAWHGKDTWGWGVWARGEERKRDRVLRACKISREPRDQLRRYEKKNWDEMLPVLQQLDLDASNLSGPGTSPLEVWSVCFHFLIILVLLIGIWQL